VLHISVYIPPTDKPSKPIGPLTVSNVTERTADLEWEAPESDGGLPLLNYIIEMKQTSRSTWIKSGTVDGKTTLFTVSELLAGNEYNFRVTAVNKEGESPALKAMETAKPVKKIGMCDELLTSSIADNLLGHMCNILYSRHPYCRSYCHSHTWI
jgi:hypothetical protein